MSMSHHLGVMATGNFFSYLLTLGPNLDHPFTPHTHTLTLGRFFFKIKWFAPWVRGKACTKNEVDWLFNF